MIDLHTHILPGVDDGVKSEDEAVEFARVAREDGVKTIVATPHCKDGFFVNDRLAVLAAVEHLRRRLDAERVDVELLPGAEVHLCADLLDRVRDGRAPTLGDNGKTLLLELSLTQHPPGLENLVFHLKLGGVLTLFAHPERIRYFQEEPARYEALVRLGAFGQLTTGSILGTFGTEATRLSEWMLKRGLVHVLASDSHNLRGRRPVLSAAVAAVAAVVGEERALRMVTDVPATLLRGEEPDLPAPDDEPPRRRGGLARWLGLGGRSDGS